MTPPTAPSDQVFPVDDLHTHLALCEEVLSLVTEESEALRAPGPFVSQDFSERRNHLLPRLDQSLNSLRSLREAWHRLDSTSRVRQTGVDILLRRNQDLIMKIIVIDRENEQALLRRGLLPPSHLPMSSRQRPHTVAEHYLKNLPA